MAKTTVVARVLDDNQLECQIDAPNDKKLLLNGSTTDANPTLKGSSLLKKNLALVDNAWGYAKCHYLKVNLPTAKEQKNAEKSAKAFREEAEWIAELVASPGDTWKKGWCSSCFASSKTMHQKVERVPGPLPAYLCKECGSPTLPCADPRCDNMAVRESGAIKIPRFCAEHRHDITGFEKANSSMGVLENYKDFFKYEQPNLSSRVKLAGAGLAAATVLGPASLLAAPAVGGAIGTLVGLQGAAASSYGLALLGGGSLAAGGFGMAGGTIVVASVGAALGGALGASVTNAYVREDKSFAIEKLQDGTGVPVVLCNGFLSEGNSGWGEWKDLIAKRYPDSPVYKVHWGAKELKDLGILAGYGALKGAGPAVVKNAAMAANKAAAKKLGPVAPVFVAAELAKNPWHVAKSRADKTGVVLADLLARTDAESYVLIGHSLGARVMVIAARNLGTKTDGPRVQSAHLTGAAIRTDGDWSTLTTRVDDAIYNYHSTNDNVLKYLYTTAMAGQKAAGSIGFTQCPPKLKNIDGSAKIERHSDYYTKLKLR